MARGRHSPTSWSTSFRMDPNAKRNTMLQSGVRSHMQDLGREAKNKLASQVINPAYRSRLVYRTYEQDNMWKVWFGTYSSFAHWEEFGAMNWHGPIGPMRRVAHSMGIRMADYGPNSMGPPG
jgi:hypothetical protein